ncbi:MAG: hypothetical protein V4633_12015 [Pseudomonadota bacterium]
MPPHARSPAAFSFSNLVDVRTRDRRIDELWKIPNAFCVCRRAVARIIFQRAIGVVARASRRIARAFPGQKNRREAAALCRFWRVGSGMRAPLFRLQRAPIARFKIRVHGLAVRAGPRIYGVVNRPRWRIRASRECASKVLKAALHASSPRRIRIH